MNSVQSTSVSSSVTFCLCSETAWMSCRKSGRYPTITKSVAGSTASAGHMSRRCCVCRFLPQAIPHSATVTLQYVAYIHPALPQNPAHHMSCKCSSPPIICLSCGPVSSVQCRNQSPIPRMYLHDTGIIRVHLSISELTATLEIMALKMERASEEPEGCRGVTL